MQKVDIHLPPDDLIDLWDLTRRIAKSICPSLRAAKDHTWLHYKLEPVPCTEFETRTAMTTQERQMLLHLLPGLPPRAGMSKKERQLFMEAFSSHPERPAWRPILVTEEEIAANGFEVLKIQEDYLLALRLEIEAGHIVAFDQHHLRETRTGKNIFISRADALAFLKFHHLRATENPSPESVAPASQHASWSDNLQPGIANLRKQGKLQTTELVSVPVFEEQLTQPARTITVTKPQEVPINSPSQVSKTAPKRQVAGLVSQDIQPLNAPLVILRRKQVEERTSLSRSAIYDRLDPNSPRHDPSFPKQIKLSANSAGWVEAEIDQWLRTRLRARK